MALIVLLLFPLVSMDPEMPVTSSLAMKKMDPEINSFALHAPRRVGFLVFPTTRANHSSMPARLGGRQRATGQSRFLPFRDGFCIIGSSQMGSLDHCKRCPYLRLAGCRNITVRRFGRRLWQRQLGGLFGHRDGSWNGKVIESTWSAHYHSRTQQSSFTSCLRILA